MLAGQSSRDSCQDFTAAHTATMKPKDKPMAADIRLPAINSRMESNRKAKQNTAAKMWMTFDIGLAFQVFRIIRNIGG